MLRFSASPNSSRFALGRTPTGEPDGGLAVEAKQGARRVDVVAAHGGDVAEAEEATVEVEVDGADAVLGVELAADADEDALGARLDHSRRHECRSSLSTPISSASSAVRSSP